LEGTYLVPGVSCNSIQGGVLFPQLPVVANIAAIPSEKTMALAQTTEEIPITEAKIAIGAKMDNSMKCFNATTF
jgi:hypothetical protein